jgi:hypothetical protein
VDTTREDTTKAIIQHNSHNSDTTTTSREATTSTLRNKKAQGVQTVWLVWALLHAAAVCATFFSDEVKLISI